MLMAAVLQIIKHILSVTVSSMWLTLIGRGVSITRYGVIDYLGLSIVQY